MKERKEREKGGKGTERNRKETKEGKPDGMCLNGSGGRELKVLGWIQHILLGY